MWSAQSPHLNPVENLWNDVDKAVREAKSNNLDELGKAVTEGWRSIAAEKCRKLISSMSARCCAVIDGKGGPAKH